MHGQSQLRSIELECIRPPHDNRQRRDDGKTHNRTAYPELAERRVAASRRMHAESGKHRESQRRKDQVSADDAERVIERDRVHQTRQYADAPSIVIVTSIRAGGFNIAVSSGGGFLVLSEAFCPGWHAQVDGREVTVIPADDALQGIEVPAGEHRVRFVFNALRSAREAR